MRKENPFLIGRDGQLRRCFWILAVLCALIPSETFAVVQVMSLFSDDMILQRDVPVRIWGTADPGEAVEVSFSGQSVSVVTGSDGKWKVQLKPLRASLQGQSLLIKGKANTLEFKNVVVGEVWLCSGQSNMRWSMSAVTPFKETTGLAVLPGVRLFAVPEIGADVLRDEFPWKEGWMETPGKWRCADNARHVVDFSAVAFYFSKELHERLGVPVGMIQCAVGGAQIESWLPGSTQEKLDPRNYQYRLKTASAPFDEEAARPRDDAKRAKYQADFAKAMAGGWLCPEKPFPENPRQGRGYPGGFYNAMIHPATPFSLRGILWYQGEFNVAHPDLYRAQMPALIESWRSAWGSQLPFLFVQLPGYGKAKPEPVPDMDQWPFLREAQAMALKVPLTGMAVIHDVSDGGLHPKNKKDVGVRLAMLARNIVHGESLETYGPRYESFSIREDSVVIQFSHCEGGLALEGQSAAGFAVAGEDRQWQEAEVQFAGNTAVLRSKNVPRPVAARYNWADFPVGALRNKNGLPAPPFRTDDWPPVKK